MDVSTSPGQQTASSCQQSEEDLVENLILDYGCKNYMQSIISEIMISKEQHRQHELRIPHLRYLAATIYTIIYNEAVDQYDDALKHLRTIHESKPDVVSDRRWVKLTAGLKAKVILSRLKTGFDYASVCAKLNQYFPKSELKSAADMSQEQARLSKYQLSLRRRLTRLIICPAERDVFIEDEENQELGKPLTESLKEMIKMYADSLNESLKVPVIEQISSEGPASQISKDIQDSPTSCMDHLLSLCFSGPPTENQLHDLLRLIRSERIKTSEAAESLRLSSDSGSDDRGHRRNRRMRESRPTLGRPRDGGQRSSNQGSSTGNTNKEQNEKSSSSRIVTNVTGNKSDLGLPATTTPKKDDLKRTSPEMLNDDKLTRTTVAKKNDNRLSSTATANTSDASKSTERTTICDDLTKGQSSKVIGEIRNIEPVQSLSLTQSLPPRSKIYFTSMGAYSQPMKKAAKTVMNDKRQIRSQVARASNILARQDNANDGQNTGVSQPDSASSGSSSQSTTSLSILSPTRGKLMEGGSTKRAASDLVEVLETPSIHDQQSASVEYIGSVIVIDETPSSGEVNKYVDEEEHEYQCNIVSSSSSSGSSGPSQPSQNKEEDDNKISREKQCSDESSLFDTSIVYPTPDAVDTNDKFTYIRTPLVQDKPNSSDSQEDVTSDDEEASSVVSDSSKSDDSLDYSPVKRRNTSSRYPRRRIPSLRSFLESPVKQATWSPVSGKDEVLVIKPCVVILNRLQGTPNTPKQTQFRRSRRLCKRDGLAESDKLVD